ncbi:MAG: RelA/SpoT family protein [Rectinemataceae bacterium]
MDDKLRQFLDAAQAAYGDSGAQAAARALEWTKAKHGAAVRASGEPAWAHDLRVAETLLDMGMDLDSVLAGLVHDTCEGRGGVDDSEPQTLPPVDLEFGPESDGAVEDKAGASDALAAPAGSKRPLRPVHAAHPGQRNLVLDARRRALAAVPDPEIAGRFGEETAKLVAGVSRLSSVRAKNKTVQAAETMRKMLFAMTGDIRVIIVKLADKLDSMRTLKWLPEERQKLIASECLDIFAPLADRLGISWLKDELEDLSLKVVNREAYDQIKEIVAAKKGERENFLDRVGAEIRSTAEKEGVRVELSARAKHFYSIYQKMRKKAKSSEELFDLLGLRLICDSENDCYALLGMVHRLWKPIDGRFKDYIAMPKANGYRSLHSTVMCYDGRLLEVQIRTRDMHTVAEYGVASHWLYKKGSTAERPKLEDLPIVNRLKQWNEFLANGAEYLEEIKRELLKDSIFVFTPQGDVIELPAGATPIDFAFAIHTDVGSHCIGAKADGAIVPLDAELRNTQVVEVLTSPSARPNLNWLKLARTSKARSKIRSLLVQNGQALAIDKNIVAGKKAEKEKPEEKGHEPAQAEEAKTYVARRESEGNRTEIEYRSYRPGQELRNEKAGVAIGGARNMMIRIAGCCRPVTGDAIVGYVSRGRGIIVHRADCRSLAAIADFAPRRIEVRWEDDVEFATARFRVTARMAPDIFSEIEAAVHKFSGRLREGKLAERGDGTLSGFFTMELASRDDLKKVAKALKALPTVLSLEEE